MEGDPTGLSLSHTRYELLDQCQRRYILKYGADHLPQRMMWDAKQQGRLMGWSMFVGQVVDETIGTALDHYRQEGRWPTSLRGAADEIMVKWWQSSILW